MKIIFRSILFFTVCLLPAFAVAQSSSGEVDVTVDESVLNTASWANFKYMDQLNAAKKGDQKAISALLDFSGTVDGVNANRHSVTLLELIVSAGDKPFALSVNLAKPKLRSILLDRLMLAQGRTKKEELRRPMAEWAPYTWAALNNKQYIPPGSGAATTSKKPNMANNIKCEPSDNSAHNAPVDVQNTTVAPPSVVAPKGKQ